MKESGCLSIFCWGLGEGARLLLIANINVSIIEKLVCSLFDSTKTAFEDFFVITYKLNI